MISYHKPKPTVKMETVEEWQARTGNQIKKVDFVNAYDSIQNFSRDNKTKVKTPPNTKMGQIHKQNIEQGKQMKKEFQRNAEG